jgi:hypothetical protein
MANAHNQIATNCLKVCILVRPVRGSHTRRAGLSTQPKRISALMLNLQWEKSEFRNAGRVVRAASLAALRIDPRKIDILRARAASERKSYPCT